MVLTAINEEEFKSQVEIRFNNISEGFNKYINGTLKGMEKHNKTKVEENIIKFIEEAVEINGEENSYIDFYYSRLSPEDKHRLQELLIDEDRAILKKLEENLPSEGIYFRLTKVMVPFFTRLCTKEVLFSTFYFTKIPCTIWGNYNMEFPCFFKKKDEMNKYEDISILWALNIH